MSTPRRRGFPEMPKLCPKDDELYWDTEDPEELSHPECRAAARHFADQFDKLMEDRSDEV